jgi:hypothetical protein
MNKKILAISVSAVMAVAVLASVLGNAVGQVSTENRTVATMLKLTNIIKGQVTDYIDVGSNIQEDLRFKQKFWQLVVEVSNADSVGIGITCGFEDVDPSACALNLESLQLQGEGGVLVESITIDGVTTDISEKELTTPTNLLVDISMGKFGVAESISVQFAEPWTGTVEWNGEKPQDSTISILQ